MRKTMTNTKYEFFPATNNNRQLCTYEKYE